MSIQEQSVDHDVFLRFQVTRATYNLGQSTARDVPREVTLDLASAWDQDIRLADETSLQTVPWHLRILDTDNISKDEMRTDTLGYIEHFKQHKSDTHSSPEFCFLFVAFDSRRFASLMQAMLNGHFPSTATLRVQGMTYGRESDGSDKEWNKEKVPNPVIIEVTLDFPLSAAPADATPEIFEDTPDKPVPEELTLLRKTLGTIEKLEATIWKVFWASLLVALILRFTR